MIQLVGLVLVVVGIIIMTAIGIAGALLIGVISFTVYLATLPAYYIQTMLATLRIDSREAFPLAEDRPTSLMILKGHIDENLALPSYYFGPIFDDLKEVTQVTSRRCLDFFESGADYANGLLSMSAPLIGIVAWSGIWLGIIAGGAVGLAGSVVVALIHLLVAVILLLVAQCVALLLRFLDSIRLFLSGVRMTCPNCAETVAPYPVYICPRCSELHKDIRSGPYGIGRRTCKCGQRLPTLLLIGASRLTAICPICGAPLPPKFGVAPEIVLPFIGGVNAGKTRLMYSIVLALGELVTELGGVMKPVGDTEGRIGRINTQLSTTGSSSKTIASAPKAYVLHVTLGANQRLVYLFDAAGELHYGVDRLEDLRYLDKATTFIFVVDPLAWDSIWLQLPSERRRELGTVRSDAGSAELAYHQTREQMRKLGRDGNSARMAFVISKYDLLAGTDAYVERSHAAARQLLWDACRLDMGDVAREASQSFSAIEFFQTTSVPDQDGAPDDSVRDLAKWLMQSEGVVFGK